MVVVWAGGSSCLLCLEALAGAARTAAEASAEGWVVDSEEVGRAVVGKGNRKVKAQN